MEVDTIATQRGIVGIVLLFRKVSLSRFTSTIVKLSNIVIFDTS